VAGAAVGRLTACYMESLCGGLCGCRLSCVAVAGAAQGGGERAEGSSELTSSAKRARAKAKAKAPRQGQGTGIF
jgi:hypothetical protein